MKTVERLKKKHRNALWIDGDGDVWFYDAQKGVWRYLDGYSEEPLGVQDISNGIATPDDFHGPYKRLYEFGTL